MREMTSLEIRQIVKELSFLAGTRIDKVFLEDRELRIAFSSSLTKKELLIAKGKIYLTDKVERGDLSDFAIFLRKHMRGKIIRSIEQYKFDRIVEIKLDDVVLICELFHKGNFILCDSEYNILNAMEFRKWKGREIVPRSVYNFPESNDITIETEFRKGLLIKHKVAAFLHVNGFGEYSESMVKMAKVSGDTIDLSEGDIDRLYNVIKFYLDKNEPFGDSDKLSLIGGDMESFNEAANAYYSSVVKESKEEISERKDSERLGRIEKKQKESLNKLNDKQSELEQITSYVNNNFMMLDDLLKFVRKNKKNWKELVKEKGFDVRGMKVVVKTGGIEFGLNITKTLNQNLNEMFKEIKKIKKKKEGASKHIANAAKKVKVKRAVREKKEWYHKYKNFMTSDGFLVVSGKDAQSNENLIKKNTGVDDVVFHADIQGAAFTVVKDARDVSDKSLFEAATFSACNSKAWAMGLGTVNVYWVRPDQIDKEAPGQYLSKGSFMIHGDRNYVRNVVLRMAVGVLTDGRIIVAPENAVAKQTAYYVIITPGDDKDLGKKIRRRLETKVPDEMKEIVKSIKPGEFVSRIPSNRASLV